LETLATEVGDRETAQLAKAIRRDEERMAKFLERSAQAPGEGGRESGHPKGSARQRRPAAHATQERHAKEDRCPSKLQRPRQPLGPRSRSTSRAAARR
jgi:hypothetical protein